MAAIASFHLVRDRRRMRSLARLALDRPELRRTTGLRFWRVLGTGVGQDTATSVDPYRRALFAVWEDDQALDEFLAASPVAARWRHGRECYTVRLRPVSGHGRWRGVDPLAGLDAGRPSGPQAVLTRATVRLRRWREFAAAGRPVNDDALDAPGLLAVVGVGEAPVGRLGTFSLWRSGEDIDVFVRERGHHRDVVQRTRRDGWYREELFARFEPYAPEGAWHGRDPLAGLLG
jgi:heme-degrading monooxygenase HmoA